jgi:hypothetical protein
VEPEAGAVYKTFTYHIGDDDQHTEVTREDDGIKITVLNGDEALEVFIDPAHFAALRKAMDMADTHTAGRAFHDMATGELLEKPPLPKRIRAGDI